MNRREFMATATVVTVASPLIPVLAGEPELSVLPTEALMDKQAAEAKLLEEVETADFVLYN